MHFWIRSKQESLSSSNFMPQETNSIFLINTVVVVVVIVANVIGISMIVVIFAVVVETRETTFGGKQHRQENSWIIFQAKTLAEYFFNLGAPLFSTVPLKLVN